MPASTDDSGTSESGANEDLKAKMREALEKKKQGGAQGLHGENPLKEKAHGSEVSGGAAPKSHSDTSPSRLRNNATEVSWNLAPVTCPRRREDSNSTGYQ